MESPPIRNALISVSDKLGLADFARELTAAGVTIYSTGGTRRHLESEGLEVRDVSAYTGFPEMMDGRVKTLHPKVHGGILCRHDHPEDRQALEQHGIVSFELVVVNLYPFQATIARPDVTREEAVEQIDIGGPSLVRAAAKNHPFVTIATSGAQYAEIARQLKQSGRTTLELRRRLAGEAFEHTARYDRAIADWFARGDEAEPLPSELHICLQRKAMLRYGENPHQTGAVYGEPGAHGANLVTARQLSGKELSYNNLLDLDSALAMVRRFEQPAAVVIKHNNPCGAAVAASLALAARRALDGDSLSAFGSVLGFNQPLDAATADELTRPNQFIEAIVAPSFEPEAREILTTRPKWKANVRLMEVGRIEPASPYWDYRRIAGGLLVQQADVEADPESEWQVVTDARPTDAQWADLRFAWTLVQFVKSNAIVVAKDGMLLGAGAGQMSRVDSVEIALRKAGERAQGAALASDAFFPFDDSVRQAAAAGISAIIQPGGSRNDEQVIAACNQHGMPMIFTGRRHFKH